MKLWLQRVVVVLVTILTLGFYVPSFADEDASAMEGESSGGGNDQQTDQYDTSNEFAHLDSEETLWSIDEYVDEMTTLAREQTFAKLGPKIVDRVEDEILTEILPQIEDVITTLYEQADDDLIPNYTITEATSSGYGEKIFHIYDQHAEKDVIRFHVRRDMKPKQGYWFNFHYHLSDDGFEEHHPIGEVYWDKNTPPKWMAN
ncbi:YpjP family protein [Paenalkalicoccus suaedae]|uniref:YpjP family protein n=1 Tax=Paenalkalicoccus suaedae TaxID=2592382 RepID=A0A859FDQ7_9BACI|nr:YpjP family protein [Paenalkalicoccus suaedae]QKS70385.1 YpjP family protein [Paenalkalicoccus suaedae]